MKTIYLGLVCDHSSSMSRYLSQANKDINEILHAYNESADDICVKVSILPFSSTVDSYDEWNTDVTRLQNRESLYRSSGSTALYDAIGTILNDFSNFPVSEDTQFMIMIFTDGEENSSTIFTPLDLNKKISELQNKGNWTITLRAPNSDLSQNMARKIGILFNNIHFWDGRTVESYQESTHKTVAGIRQYINDTKIGARSSKTFYANLDNVSPEVIKNSMVDISKDVDIYMTTMTEEVKPFILSRRGSFVPGTVFYELVKSEWVVQEYKRIMVRSKLNGSVYIGDNAKSILKLPSTGSYSLHPGDHGDFNIFIQSNSVNRKLPSGTMVAVYENKSNSTIVPTKTVTPKFQVTPAPTPNLIYDKGFKDGKNHKKRKWPDDTRYMQGYNDGRKFK